MDSNDRKGNRNNFNNSVMDAQEHCSPAILFVDMLGYSQYLGVNYDKTG